jgi:hypothetical protein
MRAGEGNMAITRKKHDQPQANDLSREQTEPAEQAESDNWSLTSAQMFFMLEHHNLIEQAYADQDLTEIHKLAASKKYKQLFGLMSWDEAYDRYEEFLFTGSGNGDA